MAHLIDKDTLIAEIAKMLQEEYQCDNSEQTTGYHCALYELQYFLNTLEVKEVDLEKEYKDFVEEDPVYNKLVNGIVGKAIARHFFVLGLKAQKEIDYEN